MLFLVFLAHPLCGALEVFAILKSLSWQPRRLWVWTLSRKTCMFLTMVWMALARRLESETGLRVRRLWWRTLANNVHDLDDCLKGACSALGVRDRPRAVAGESSGIIGLYEVSESDSQLHISRVTNSLNSSLGVDMSACARAASALLHGPQLHACLILLVSCLCRGPPVTACTIRGRTRLGRVPREGGAPKVGFPVRPKICVLSQRWRQG